MMKGYDRKASNRQRHDVLIGNLDKEASESLMTAIHGEGFDRVAAFQAVDRMTKTKRMVQSSLGIDDARASEVASVVLVKANQILNRFGGNLDAIIEEMVAKMTEQTDSRGMTFAKDGVNITPAAFRPSTRGELSRHIETRINQQFGWSGMNAALVKNVTNLTNNLAMELRKPRSDVADAILDLYAEAGAVPSEAFFHADLDPEVKRELCRRIEEGA